jgi:Tol biopolymer transport system component
MLALDVGTRIGPYEILQFSGAGGMGQVYRARDTRLNRDVAVKILPDALLHDHDPLARFRREAQVLASLNHPNIATIHGLEESDGVRALVMEFVEGRTLAEIIAGSRAGGGAPVERLSLSDAVNIARQIAEALEAAHEQGIIHRDLKPANVIVREDGAVKVLDFGLAKALDPAYAAAQAAVGAPMGTAPTVTSPAVTNLGVILGTAAYMSPEQARGKPVDKRADIWAFGVVLYEMVMGRRLFQGENVTDVLAAVVKDAPDLSAAPPALRRLLEKCLEKDPHKRLRDISSVPLLLEETVSAHPAPAGQSRSKAPLAVAAVMTVVAAAASAAAFIAWRRAAPAPRPIEFSIEAPPGTTLANIHSGSAVSPDGQYVVFSAGAAGGSASLWLRELRSMEARLLPGTERATSPVWSPDGKSIAFMADKQLKRLDLAGAPVVTLAEVPRADPNQPGAWNPDGVIVFGCPCGLDRVSASGGAVTPIRKVDGGIKETAYAAPQFLPDGDRFIYFVASSDPKVQGVYATSLKDPSQRTLILNTGAKAVFVPPRGRRPGYLLWMQAQTLQARAFDADSLQWKGDPFSLAEGVATAPGQVGSSPRAAFWVSGSGLLLYARGPAVDPKLPLVWFGIDGKALGDAASEGPYNAISIAPDQQRVALTRYGIPRTDDPHSDIWVWDFARHTNTRITFGPTTDENPVWSPDGKQIAFSSDRDGGFFNLYRKDSSGAGEEERLTTAKLHMDPLDWSPDGRYLVYREMHAGTGWDLMLLPLQGDRKPIVLLQTPESDSDARFSPDGRWLAYHSRLNGTTLEVFVQAFSGDGQIGLTGSRVQVSNNGGGGPLWRRDGHELFYHTLPDPTSPQAKIMAVPIQFAPTPRPGRPRELFRADIRAGIMHPKDVSADGKKFLLVLGPRQKQPTVNLTVVTDWQAIASR